MKQYKIGEVAKLLGLTTQALRFYEQEGIVTPSKSENGTRYYSIADLHKLLSVKKYRMAEFAVQDIVQHLRCDSLHDLSMQIDDKCDELIARSEELLRRAQTLRQFRHEVDEAERNINVLVECMRPELYAQNVMINDLDELTPRERREMNQYIEALPATGIAFTRDIRLKKPPQFFLCVTRENAQKWGLSLEHTHLLTSVKCISSYVRLPKFAANEPIEKLIEQAKKQGYTINSQESMLCLHIASDVFENEFYVCGQIFIPVI